MILFRNEIDIYTVVYVLVYVDIKEYSFPTASMYQTMLVRKGEYIIGN